jgi:lysophospholipase L1-like esterase
MQSFKENPVPCIGLDLMNTGDSITLRVLKSDSTQKVFELYGMSLETRADTGLVYHAPGIGSAQFTAVLEEELLDFQLPLLKPDLVVLDFGTNDIFKMRHPDEDLINRINLAIDRIRNAAPEATLMLTSTQDMYNRKRHITSPEWFSGLIRGIAKEKSCVFYDWYQVSGGSKTVKEWLKKGLTQPDRVHLSGKGYRLKGQLFAEALERSVKWHMDHPESDSLVNILSINKLSNDSVSPQNLTKMNTEIVKPVDRKSSKTFLLYKVQPGDTLGLIAQKHRVSIAELKKWNGIRGSLIRSGQKIKIYSKTKV